jgi:hypothetical protein
MSCLMRASPTAVAWSYSSIASITPATVHT